ncbi:secreted protein [Beggiatoa sp. PS]|nr:secreted protein [Beggiatoa sp. PS]
MTHFMKSIVLLVISLVLFGCTTSSKPAYTTTQSYAPIWLQDVLTFDGTKSGGFQGLKFLRRENKRLKPGDEVKTDAKTIKILAFTTGMTDVILKPNTHVRILDSAIELIPSQTEYSDNQSELFITTSNQWKKWNKKFQVKTRTVTIIPMGTKFSINAHKQEVSTVVIEGSVQLESNKNNWLPTVVQQHEKGIVRGEQNPPDTQKTTHAEIEKIIHPITQMEMAVKQENQEQVAQDANDSKLETIIHPITKMEMVVERKQSSNLPKEPTVPFEICEQSKTWKKPSKSQQSKRMWGDNYSRTRYSRFYSYDENTFFTDPDSPWQYTVFAYHGGASEFGDLKVFSGLWIVDSPNSFEPSCTRGKLHSAIANAQAASFILLLYQVKTIKRQGSNYTVIVESTTKGYQWISISTPVYGYDANFRVVTVDGKTLKII